MGCMATKLFLNVLPWLSSMFCSNKIQYVFTGKFKGSDEDAIISLSKTPFTEDSVKSILSKETKLKKEFNNDIYGQFIAETTPNLNTLATNTIHPATEKHIMKYTAQDIFLVDETAEDYQNITLPYLEKQQFSTNVRFLLFCFLASDLGFFLRTFSDNI